MVHTAHSLYNTIVNMRDTYQNYSDSLILAHNSTGISKYLHIGQAVSYYWQYRSLLNIGELLDSFERTLTEVLLAGYGVIPRITPDDVAEHEEIGGTFNEFTDEQLVDILDGVNAVARTFLEKYPEEYRTPDLSPQQVFQNVMGTIHFGHVQPDPGYAETAATGWDGPNETPEIGPTIISNPIFIALSLASFRTPPDNPTVGFGTSLPRSFVVVHELGHAFHNRHGGKHGPRGIAPISGPLYADATDGTWIEATEYWDAGALNVKDARLFPNEFKVGEDPSEGFSDSFANFVLDRGNFLTESKRLAYFKDNLTDWIRTIIERTPA